MFLDYCIHSQLEKLFNILLSICQSDFTLPSKREHLRSYNAEQVIFNTLIVKSVYQLNYSKPGITKFNELSQNYFS